ncbi:membrane protein insertase YidC [Sneathiella sp. P13V-1]|uniref:membrane protein insertase YidC n=1 Tax=Sneathiella sp. P13V-1 TaxID=2697366 RepID=UPI00187BAEFA|nr:membrane protein insertase YidC [Sneathiella sp. P13V-1]MBE7635416.1 membrane protein insertase YidC [Sneathiella sp. P13V-1]
MSDQKNVFLAVILCLAIILGWQYFFPSPVPEQTAEQQAIATDSSTPAPTGVTPGNASAPSSGAAPAQVLSREEVLGKAARVKINTPSLHGSISLKGARFDDVTLINYRQEVDPNSGEIVLFAPSGSPNPYYADFGWSIAPGTNVKLPTPDTIWSTSAKEITPDKPLVLTWDNGEGLVFTRTIAVDDKFLFTVEQKVQNNTSADVTLFPYGLISRTGMPEVEGFYILHEGLIGVFNETLEEIDYDDLMEGDSKEISSTGGWLGITDKFWLAALLPDQNANLKSRFNYIKSNGRFQTDYLNQTGVTIAAGQSASATNNLFTGAKEVDLLDDYEKNLEVDRLELAIDWGWFYFLTKPLYMALDFMHGHVGNMGIAILIITVFIKLFLLPLAHKSYVSMSKMKKLQPEMTKLRERFGDDRQKLNEEMMALYKKEKANPAAGCLPIIIQIPIFFALYKVLYVTLLMRHEPFYGWIKDLSAPDPTSMFNLFGLIPWDPPQMLMIGVLPVLMGLSMFLQQKFNPQPADPVQAKIFLFMPIFFTALLASFPAGLVIYWTWNNILSIAQQWYIMRRMGVSVNS